MPANVETIFHAARALHPGDRAVYLDSACGADDALRARVEALLAADEDASAFLRTADETVIDPDATRLARARTDRDDESAVSRATPGEGAGEFIGRYRLLQQIGEGGFGTVWMAEQKEPVKRRVALKIIKLGMDTKQVIARFEAERQALALMDHPNIAKVFDAGATETGRPFFVMELVRGDPIAEYCDRERLDTRQRLRLFERICGAIQHAHQKGVIHRDIKPSNVLVTLHDGEPVPKVIDFGIAKATSTELTQRTLFTEHRQMIGTPAYMSPEQAEMSGLDIDTRSDIYSLGVLLYELLTGTTPFTREDIASRGYAEMMRVIREETPAKPSTRLHSLGESATRTAEMRRADVRRLGTILRGDLDWIVMKCLEKDRTRRYESAASLAADVGRHLHDEPVQAGPPSAVYRTRKFVRRHRVAVAAASIVVLALALGVVGTSVGLVWALSERARVLEQNAAAAEAIRDANVTVASTLASLSDADSRDDAADASESLEATRAIAARIADATDLSVEALGDATRELAESLGASLREEAASRRSAERVASFQENRLGDVDVASMGIGVRSMVLDHAPAEERDALDGLLSRVNFTEIARASLGESVLARTVAAIDEEFTEEPRMHARLLDSVGGTFESIGLDGEAAAVRSRAFELAMEDRGPDDGSTWTLGLRLARNLLAHGELDEADAMVHQALEASHRLFGADSDQVHTARLTLSEVRLAQGRLEAARTEAWAAWDWRRRELGDDDPRATAALNAVALADWRAGRRRDALDAIERAHAVHEEKLGPDAPDTLATANNRALLMRELGMDRESHELFAELVTRIRALKGDRHPRTMAAIMNLATAAGRLGRYEEAEALLRESVAGTTATLGPDHADTLRSAASLAQVLGEWGRASEALAVIEDANARAERAFGPDHDLTLRTGLARAAILFTANRIGEAMAILEPLVERTERVLGPMHPESLNARGNLAACHMRVGRLADATELLERNVAALVETVGPDHPDTATAQHNLGAVLLQQMRVAEARPVIESALATRREKLGDRHPDTIGTISNLAVIVASSGDLPAAMPLVLEVYEGSQEALGPDHPQTIGGLANLARFEFFSGRVEDARVHYEDAVERARRVLGVAHPFTGNAYDGLVMTYRRMGRNEDADRLATELIDGRVRAAEADDALASTLAIAAQSLLGRGGRTDEDVARARAFAGRACAREESESGSALWRYLDLLARAQQLSGELELAVATQERAISLMPSVGGDPTATTRLQQYRAQAQAGDGT